MFVERQAPGGIEGFHDLETVLKWQDASEATKATGTNVRDMLEFLHLESNSYIVPERVQLRPDLPAYIGPLTHIVAGRYAPELEPHVTEAVHAAHTIIEVLSTPSVSFDGTDLPVGRHRESFPLDLQATILAGRVEDYFALRPELRQLGESQLPLISEDNSEWPLLLTAIGYTCIRGDEMGYDAFLAKDLATASYPGHHAWPKH